MSIESGPKPNELSIGELSDEIKNTQEEDETEVIELAKKGDKKALESLIKKHSLTIIKTLKSKLENPQDVEDVFQTLCEKLPKKLEAFNGKVLKNWIKSTARNAAIDKLRRNKIRQTLSFDNVSEETQIDQKTLPDSYGLSGTEGSIFQSQIKQEIKKAIDSLDNERDKIIIKSWMLGIPYKKIADNLDMEINTVKTKLHRIKRKLGEKIEPTHKD